MKSRVAKSTAAKNLPVFVFPEELNFIPQDQRTHKRILTIYNPYEFEISFQGKKSDVDMPVCVYINYPLVLSNAPTRYTVPNPRGTVKEHCCVDMLV